jgi:hypothetical protein
VQLAELPLAVAEGGLEVPRRGERPLPRGGGGLVADPRERPRVRGAGELEAFVGAHVRVISAPGAPLRSLTADYGPIGSRRRDAAAARRTSPRRPRGGRAGPASSGRFALAGRS